MAGSSLYYPPKNQLVPRIHTKLKLRELQSISQDLNKSMPCTYNIQRIERHQDIFGAEISTTLCLGVFRVVHLENIKTFSLVTDKVIEETTSSVGSNITWPKNDGMMEGPSRTLPVPSLAPRCGTNGGSDGK